MCLNENPELDSYRVGVSFDDRIELTSIQTGPDPKNSFLLRVC